MKLYLDVRKIRFDVTCVRKAKLLSNMGFILRGSLGNALYWLSRHYDETSKSEYLAIYEQVFKNANKPNNHRFSGNSNFEPYAMDCRDIKEGAYRAGDRFNFSLILMGQACNHVHEIVIAVKLMLMGNICGNIDCFKLISATEECNGQQYYKEDSYLTLPSLWNWHEDTMPSISGQVHYLEVDFSACSVSEQKNDYQFNCEVLFSFREFMESILRRLEGVCADHQNAACSCDDWSELLEYAESVQINESCLTQGHDSINTSKTSQKKRYVNYFEGKVIYYGDLNRFLTYIDACSVIGIGRNTVLGYGRYSYKTK